MTRYHIDGVLIGSCAVLALTAIWLSASGTEPISMMFLAIFLSAPVIVLGSTLFGYRRFTNRRAVSALIGPICALALIGSVAVTHWPLRVAYALSRPSLDSFAIRLHTGERLARPERVGMFTIRKAEIGRYGIVCLWTMPHPNGNTGFVQCGPENIPFNLWSVIELDDHWQFISED